MHAGERPKETAEVVALQNYLTECKEERIVKLKDEIKKAAERVIFLLYHAQLDGKMIYLKSVIEIIHYLFTRCSVQRKWLFIQSNQLMRIFARNQKHFEN